MLRMWQLISLVSPRPVKFVDWRVLDQRGCADRPDLLTAILEACIAQSTATQIERTRNPAILKQRQTEISGNPVFRKAYFRLFNDSVTVGDSEIALTGPKAALAEAATHMNSGRYCNGAQFCSSMASRRGFEPLSPP